MIKKILLAMLLLLFLGTPAMAQRYRQFQFVIVDEFGDAVTNIDQIQIFDAGTSTSSTIYADRNGTRSMTNPMTTSSTNTGFVQATGMVTWFQANASYKVAWSICPIST